jgi:hypothetical protein
MSFSRVGRPVAASWLIGHAWAPQLLNVFMTHLLRPR